MSKLQDLEQEFLRCWEVTQDLHLLYEVANDGSDHTDTIKGIIEVYEMRFDKAWGTYEELVKEYYALRDKANPLSRDWIGTVLERAGKDEDFREDLIAELRLAGKNKKL